MDTTTGYKNRALRSLNAKWEKPVLCTLVIYLIAAFISLLTNTNNYSGAQLLLSLVLNIAFLPLGWAFYVLFLDFVRGDHVAVGSVFLGYKKPWWSKSLRMPLLYTIYIILWTLLFIIPGIIKSYSYAMSYYVLRDNPDISCNAAIEESMRLMSGHKMDLFILQLSFFGWIVLSLLTLGIGFLWLGPYYQSAQAHFYEDLIREKGTFAEPIA